MQPSLLAIAISTCTIANIFFEGSMRRDLCLFIPVIRMAICMKSRLNWFSLILSKCCFICLFFKSDKQILAYCKNNSGSKIMTHINKLTKRSCRIYLIHLPALFCPIKDKLSGILHIRRLSGEFKKIWHTKTSLISNKIMSFCIICL